MKRKKIVVIGGVAGGASFVARMRRLDEDAEIILLERGPHISFANCGLPYYIGGTIRNRDSLLIQTPENMHSLFNIDVRVEQEVTSVDPTAKSVAVKNLQTGESYTETYDYLVLSPGAQPIKPPIPGIDTAPVFTVRNVPDVDALKNYIKEHEVKHAIVIGGGYIGLEMADNLHELGLNISIVEQAKQIIGTMDYDMAAVVSGHMLSKGVHLYLDDGVTLFKQNKSKTDVVLNSGKTITGDLIILAIGVKPDVSFLRESTIALGPRGGIRVNASLETSIPDVYAIGDAVEIEDFNSGNMTLIPLAGPANKQGRIVADNIAGLQKQYKGTQATAIAKIFDLTVATTGYNERSLQTGGIPYLTAITQPKSHAGYYPGALPYTIKLHFSPDGHILGSQIVGYDGVDKSIDVIATALRQRLTVNDLQELELAYAPPFSSAKDPVNMVGFVAENMLSERMQTIAWQDIAAIDPKNTTILDVGEDQERELGAIEGSHHIPLGKLRDRLNELSQEKSIIVYCQVGLRAYIAARILQQRGYTAKVISGGYKHYAGVTNALAAIESQDFTFGGKGMNFTDVSKQDVYSSETASQVASTGNVTTVQLDACGLSCPGPIVEVYKHMNELKEGDILEVLASDPGFPNDIAAWCKKTGHTLLQAGKDGKSFKAILRKGTAQPSSVHGTVELPKNKTIVVFSSDLDKVIAAFIIANGAAAMGRKVTMFFTFWGLNALRKTSGPKPSKTFMDKMFGMMMPRGSKKLGLSRLHMLGIGPKLIRHTMASKNISSLEELIQLAKENGVNLIACNMSMDVMGIKQEELIDGVDIGGVAAYLGEAEDSNHNLFI
jgi:NADPH-dependent 2,4-dienoyl-CoA reductase/sulfur reductase-like enzyme/peroxiredoxin family protein/TusA-related sulfurtransferase/rhodanese-related sulfurtransferase